MMRCTLSLTLAVAVLSTSLEEEYESFRQEHGRSCSDANISSVVSCLERMAIYAKNKADVEARNAAYDAGKSSWKATVNKFADFTELEKHAMRGYRRGGSWFEKRGYKTHAHSGSSLLEGATIASTVNSKADFEAKVHASRKLVAESVDWRSKGLASDQFILNQQACGSCWAIAAVGALEYHSEIHGSKAQQLSWAQLVDCVPNPEECGGRGGCSGATAELAFEYVKSHGLAEAANYKGTGTSSGSLVACDASAQTSVSSSGWVRLPENKLQPLMEALTNDGPVVVSVSAGNWMHYNSGVFDDCSLDATIDHAVLMVGYGTDLRTNKPYWLVRNSWGPSWGESGFIRILRHETENAHCGIDYEPKAGVGCNGGPPTLPVCGMCGILSDSSYPQDVVTKSTQKTYMRAQ